MRNNNAKQEKADIQQAITSLWNVYNSRIESAGGLVLEADMKFLMSITEAVNELKKIQTIC